MNETLQNIVSPLFAHLGFTHFTYCRFKQGSRYLTLNVDADLLIEYFQTDLDRNVIFNGIQFPKYSKKTLIWDLQEDTPLMEYMKKKGYFHGISIYYRHDELIEAWHFATNEGNGQINKLYTHDLAYIDKFIAYFNEKANDIISVPEQLWAVFSNGMSLDLNSLDKSDQIESNSLSKFLEETKLRRIPFERNGERIFLTSTEFDCYCALAEGLSLKAIAQLKDISPRTVESHLHNLKAKLDVYSKTKLISEYKQSLYAQLKL